MQRTSLLAVGLLLATALAGCLGGEDLSETSGPSTGAPTGPGGLSVTGNETFETTLDAGAGVSESVYGRSPGVQGSLDPSPDARVAVVNLSWEASPTLETARFALLACESSCEEGGETLASKVGQSPITLTTVTPEDGTLGWRVQAGDGAAAGTTFTGEATYLAGEPAGPSDPADRVVRFTGDGTVLAPPETPGPTGYHLTGFHGAEPNVGVSSEGAIFVTAHDQVIRSTDQGRSWEEVWHFAEEDNELGGSGPVSNNDPMLWLDPATDRVFADPMWPVLSCSYLAWSDDGGESWTERPGVCHPPPMDHQKLSGGPPGPEAPAVAGELYPSVLYQCYNQVASTVCATSYDGGVDWAVHQVANEQAVEGCAGVNGKVGVGPDGVAYLPLTEQCENARVAVSTDSGLTWTVKDVPTGETGENDPDVEVGPDGTVYLLYQGADWRMHLVRSDDRGESWEGPWTVTPPNATAGVFPALDVGPDGRIGMAFLTTEHEIESPSAAPPDTQWDLQIVTSAVPEADEPAFTAHQVTPDTDPVQMGCVWLGGFPGEPCRNMLDFIDAQVGPEGDFHVAYTEGCTDSCAENPLARGPNSRDNVVALGQLDGFFAEAPDG